MPELIIAYGIFGVYLVILLLIGFLVSKRIKNVTDFLLAGRRIGFWLCMFTLAATHFGGGFVMGGGEYGFIHGLSGAWYGIACGLGLILLGFIAPRLRKLSLFTAPDYLALRYKSKLVRLLATFLSLVAIMGILAAQVIAAQGVLSMLGMDPAVGSLVAALVFILYTFIGGMWAVTLTDFFQLLVVGVGMIISFVLVITQVDFLAFSSVTSTYTSILGMGYSTIIWILLPTIFYTLIGQDFYQRLFSSKSEKIGQRSCFAAGVFLLIMSFIPALLGMSARVLLGSEIAPGQALPSLLMEVMPAPMGYFFLVAIIAAIMSTADSLLSAGASHIVKDVLQESFGKKNNLLFYSKISTVGLGFGALLIAFLSPTVIDVLVYAYTIYTSTIFIPLVLGMFWKRGSKEAAIGSILGSSVFIVLSILLVKTDIPLEIFGVVVSLLIYSLISLVRPAKS
ncbi:MAG TPA: sodium:solute symporter family protein [Thermoplasmata archaeon]|nr:sodium:solute symporter family protein [Thermoplasmata archaeon]